MRVHLIKKLTVEDYVESHAEGEQAFKRWVGVIKNVDWNTPKDMVDTFPSADILGNGTNRIVFNVGGNKFRVICSYYFGNKRTTLFIKWIGTHAEYDKLCQKGKQYTIDAY